MHQIVDTTLRKRGRPLGCTDPGHNQMCAVCGDENSWKYGIQDQMNRGVGANRPVHEPRIPLSDIMKNGNDSFVMWSVST